MGIEFDIKFNRFPTISKEMAEAIDEAVQNTGKKISADTKSRVPVKTGKLRESYESVPDGDMTAIVRSNVEYAAFVELGTRHMAPRPALLPAVLNGMDDLENELSKTEGRLK